MSEKITAEQLIEAADEFGRKVEVAFIGPFVAAAEEFVTKVQTAEKQGMGEEILEASMRRMMNGLDKVTARLSEEMDKVGEKFGAEKADPFDVL